MLPTFVPDVMPFSRRDSLLSLFLENGALVVSRFTKEFVPSVNPAREYRPVAFLLRPEAEEATFCRANPAQLTLALPSGEVSCCFDGGDTIRFRGSGTALCAEFPPKDADAAPLLPQICPGTDPPPLSSAFLDLLDGTVLLFTENQGVFLFVPLRGTLRLEGARLRCLPDVDGGWELAVHTDHCEPLRRPAYRPFEACAVDSLHSYESWAALYGELPAGWEAFGRLCAYAVWICCLTLPDAPTGYVTLYSRTDSAYCWQSAYHAMGTVRDPDAAADLLLTMFQYQDSFGQLPDLVDDRYVHYLSTKPPLQGFVFLHLLPRLRSPFTADHFRRLYDPFRRWYLWWMTWRDTDGNGIPAYDQGCECSMDTSDMFASGVPVEGPDLMAYMILLAEALQTMAAALSLPEEGFWRREGSRLLDALIRDFWTGERFIARLSGSRLPVESREIEMYTPILLGRRLPPQILHRLTADLLDSSQYWSPIGLRHAPPGSLDFMQGVVGGFWQIKLAVGLYDAGERRAAAELLRRYCEINLRLGPSLGFHERQAELTTPPLGPRLGLYSALACGIFLASAELLSEWQSSPSIPKEEAFYE